MNLELQVSSNKNKEVIDLTRQINSLIKDKDIKSGQVLVFVKHSTAAITFTEIGEGTEEDLLEVVQKMIPKINFRHVHNPSHTPDHMIGSIIGPSTVVGINNGILNLGTWQRLILLELNGPRELNLVLTFSG